MNLKPGLCRPVRKYIKHIVQLPGPS